MRLVGKLSCLAFVAFVSLAPVARACDYDPPAVYLALAARHKTWSETGHHPLAGQLYSAADGLIDWSKSNLGTGLDCLNDIVAANLQTIMTARVILIGENHDNAWHHETQSDFLTTGPQFGDLDTTKVLWTGRNRQTFGAVFEQFDSQQQSALESAAPVKDLADLKRLTNWEKSGWSKYSYDPLLQAVLNAKLPIYAGDVTHEQIMKAAKEGEAALPGDERKRLKLDQPLGEKLDAASIDEIDEAHCHTMPKDALGGLAFAQRYRDATLADNVLKAADKHGSAILFAGNGHVRTDRGVPWYIRARAPDKKVVSVMLIEVEDGKNDPESYVPRDPDGKPAADYIIFTPAAERHDDPCAKLKGK